ncbi:helix-turn-helix domain-containing protein [Erwinia sp. CPCC 100877]|nr:helix-turn-helix domain-containing protein [Erwinia sp. CPCC 100877]
MTYNSKKELGDFLKRKRDATLPEYVGIIVQGVRRTSGLRREEVAELSGVGLSWYTSLEQGRDIQVSQHLLSSILSTLQCSLTEKKYALGLAGYASIKSSQGIRTKLPPSLKFVLDSLELAPSMILDRHWNIILANEIASYVYDSGQDLAYENLIELIFLDKHYQILFSDWQAKAKELLAQFRLNFSKEFKNDDLLNFIESMKTRSDFFKACWDKHEVMNINSLNKLIIHPDLDALSFEFLSFSYMNNIGEELTLFINIPSEENNTIEKLKKHLNN